MQSTEHGMNWKAENLSSSKMPVQVLFFAETVFAETVFVKTVFANTVFVKTVFANTVFANTVFVKIQ